MKGKKDNLEAKDDRKNMNEDVCTENVETPDCEEGVCDNCDAVEASDSELETVRTELDEKTKQCSEYLNMLQRTAAEFDNYKKRTAREKEALYSDAVGDVVAAFLPAIDSLERAVQACSKDHDLQVLKDGIELVNRQFKDVLKKIGVEEIPCINENFDPEVHNAVMHVQDENCGQNKVIEEFQKGYIYKEKVIRHSMVKVAN